MGSNCDYNYHGPVVVFDLDDTLFRERDFCRSGFKFIEKYLTSKYGSEFIGISKRLDSFLRRRQNYFDWLQLRLDEDIRDLVAAYRSHRPSYLPFSPYARELLESLSDRGIIMALITDGRSVTQRHKIEALKLNRYIREEDVLISEETGHDKTSAESFRLIVRRYPEAKEFFYIGDNPAKDFLFPNIMGWTTCKVPYSYDNVHPEPELNDKLYAPKINLNNILQLNSIIK